MIRPGVLALILIVLLSFSLGIHIDRSRSALERAYSQVFVVVCGGGYGTGWFVNHEYAVTAYHVVSQCIGKNVTVVRGPWHSVAGVAAYDPVNDIAVLHVESPPGWAEGIPLTSQVAVGDPVYVIGYPVQLYEETGKNVEAMSEIPRVASGTVSWIHPDKPIFQFDIATDAGNSGGPVISKETGGAVGLVVYARPGIVSEGYFGLRMDAVARFLDENHIEYRVAGSHGWAPLLGLGVLAGLGFLVLKGVGAWK